MKKKSKLNENKNLQLLVTQAALAQKQAYAPYSQFKVGAALLTNSGKIFSGCNVENASYGGTNCAERTAIFTAVTCEGNFQIKDMVVITSGDKPWPPCGLCRQVIFEFSTEKTMIHIAQNHKGIQKIIKSYTIKELLPEAFGPKDLA